MHGNCTSIVDSFSALKFTELNRNTKTKTKPNQENAVQYTHKEEEEEEEEKIFIFFVQRNQQIKIAMCNLKQYRTLLTLGIPPLL